MRDLAGGEQFPSFLAELAQQRVVIRAQLAQREPLASSPEHPSHHVRDHPTVPFRHAPTVLARSLTRRDTLGGMGALPTRRVLVTGGTGRLGAHVVRTLRGSGIEVCALVRRGSEYFWLNDTGCDYFFGDLRDPDSLRRALRGCTDLVAVASARRERRDNHHGNVTADGNVALFEAAAARGVRNVVFVSCAAVATAPEVPHLRAKRVAEESLRRSGLRWCIVRPGLFADNLADLLRGTEHNGAGWLPGAPTTQVRPVHAPDVARICAAALDAPEASERVLDVHGPEAVPLGVAWERAAAACGLPSTRWALSPTALAALARASQPLGRRWRNRLEAVAAFYAHPAPDVRDGDHAVLGVSLCGLDEAVRRAFRDRHPGEDPAARDEKVVHRQFASTVYVPGTVRWSELPAGPPPRRD